MPRQMQYQRLAEPFQVTPPAETITVDKWFSHPQPPQISKKHVQLGGIFRPLEPSLIIEPSVMSWLRPTQTPPDKARRNPEGIVAKPLEPSLIIEPAAMSWLRPQDVPTLPSRRNPFGWIADIASWTPGTLTVDKWWRPASTLLRLAKSVRPEQFVIPCEPSLFITPTMDTWYRLNEMPVKASRRPSQELVVSPFQFLATEWLQGTQVPVSRMRQSIGVSVLAPFQEVAATVDLSWIVEHPTPPLRKRITIGDAAYPPFYETIPPPVSIAWFVQYPLPVPRRGVRIADQRIEPPEPFEVSGFISWFGQQAMPVRRKPQASTGFKVVPEFTQPPPEITVDMWFVEAFRPVLRTPPTGHMLTEPFTPIIITAAPPCPYIPGRPGEDPSFVGRLDLTFEISQRPDDNDSQTRSRPNECK